MHPNKAQQKLADNGSYAKGMGLVSAIALITLAAVLSLAIMRTVRTLSDSSVQAIVSYRAFLAAESGAHFAVNRVAAPTGSPSCTTRVYDFSQLGLPSCEASVECRTESVAGEALYTIQSTATCDPAEFMATHSVIVRLTE